MGKFIGHHNRGRLLLVTNILTATILTVLLIKEKYPSRAYHKLFSKQTEQYSSYSDNKFYEYYTTTYPLFQEQKNIVMLGNSLTACIDWKELLNRPDVTTRGIPGDITAGMLARLDYIEKLKPKIVFIEGGVNDLNGNIPQETIIKNLTSIIDTLQIKGIKPVLTAVTLLAQQFKYKNPTEQNKKIKELNDQILILSKQKNIKLIDLNPSVTDKNLLISEYAIKDGIHFTDKTYLIWKREVEKILKQEGI